MAAEQNIFHEFMPEDVWKWKFIEHRVERALSLHDYEEIRLSVLQDHAVLVNGLTALMPPHEAESVADKTLNLNMPDQDISLISLRPEGTISVLHHTARIWRDGQVHRFYYHGPMFRKDRDGRPLEFFQLGVELLGSDSILSENEVISLGVNICKALGIRDIRLRLNSFGCKECRVAFFADIQRHLEGHRQEYCRACYEELSSNPFEDTGCGDPACRHCVSDGPVISDYLCPKCQDNFSRIKKIQANLAHPYSVDPHLYKNFSYYNETVFDLIAPDGENEVLVGGGGRYDYLSEMITGKNIPAVGFYLNMDTVFSLMRQRDLFRLPEKAFSVYLCAQSANTEMILLQIAHELQGHGIRTVISTEVCRGEDEAAKARKKACALMISIREDNLRDGKILMHNLVKEDQDYIPLDQIGDAVLLARKALIRA